MASQALAPPAAAPFAIAGFAALVLLVALAQLDAVGNRLSDAMPISLYTFTYAATAGLALLAWYDGQPSRTPTAPLRGWRLAGLFFLWALFSWTLSRNRAEGWAYLVDLAAAMGLVPLIAILADTSARLRALIWTIILSGTVSAVIVHIDFLTGERLVSAAEAAVSAEFSGFARSAGGSDENPTTAAQMLMVSIGLMLGYLAIERRGRAALAGLLLLCLSALAIMAARSAIFGLAVMLVLLLASLRARRSAAVVGAAALALGLAALIFLPPAFVDRFLALGDWSSDPTLFRRFAYLRVGVDLFAQSPIWGVGPGNFPEYFASSDYRFLSGRVPGERELHNTYLDSAAELGLVGLTLLLALLGAALAGVRPQRHALEWPAFGLYLALAGLAFASFFMPNKDMRYLWILLALAFQWSRLRARGAAS
jgi:O-antigen ligase